MKKSINLKKQLAFISSLALIAGSAVYMPANVSEILGVGKSIFVSAGEAADVNITLKDSDGNEDKPTLTKVDNDNDGKTAEKPITYTAELSSVAYGTTLNYEFEGNKLATVSGSKGTITFDSADGSAATGIFKVYNSITEEFAYYQVKFTQDAGISGKCYGGQITSNALGFTYNNNNTVSSLLLEFKPSNKLEVIDGKYVKNYDVVVPAAVKAKSKITMALSGFVSGYGIGTTDNKFDVTLDENGNASTILKISSTWEDQTKLNMLRLISLLKAYLIKQAKHSNLMV